MPSEGNSDRPFCRLYVLSIDDNGFNVIEFETEQSRQEWLDGMDDTFDDFYCLDVEGRLKDAYVALIPN